MRKRHENRVPNWAIGVGLVVVLAIGSYLAFTKNAGTVGVAEIVQPISERLLNRCDAVVRIPGPSPRADELVAVARSRGLRVFFSLEEALAG